MTTSKAETPKSPGIQPAGRSDVLVVGAGVTGLSCAYHLKKLGVTSLAVAGETEPSVTARSPGLASGGQLDNFTRVAHAHGAEFAAELWRFGDLGFDRLRDFCTAHAVAFCANRRLRLVTSAAELAEARKAVQLLQAQGLAVRLDENPASHLYGKELTGRVLAVQDDGGRGGVVDVAGLLSVLSQASAAFPRLARVTKLDATSDGVFASLSDGRIWKSEIVVLAAHLGIGVLLPNLQSALVSVADQWSEVEVELAAGERFGAFDVGGIYFSANHTYEWGASLGGGRFVLGGGRYLRKWAGCEAEVAEVEARITAHYTAQFKKTYKFAAGVSALRSEAALDCRPCDELPIIGPMYGEPRILVATGYMGQGLTQGFLAGACLAALVTSGKAEALPRRLWPERLRSLEA